MLSTLPAHSIKSLVNFLVLQGVPRAKLLTFIGTTEEALNEADNTYPSSCYEQLMCLGGEHLEVPNIGFVHGKAFEISFWGLLGYIVAAAPTLGDALAYQKRYQCLLGNSGLAYHELEPDVVTMRWLSEPGASENNIEQVITAWVAFAFIYTQSNDKPLSVHFTHAPLTDIEQYSEFFGCPVIFNADFNGVKVKPASFELPLKTSNAEVLNVLCSHAEQKLKLKRSVASLDIIRQFVIEMLPDHVPDLPEVAEHLNLSVRQLQRHFQKHQTNLTQFLDDIRLNLAVSYLTQTEHKLLHISGVLGYSEQSAFQRAFKRRFGLTPGEYRLNPTPLK